MKEAILWKKMPKKEVQCFLCYRMCRIKDGERGYCRIRENQKGRLYALTYGKAIAAEVDPIEKKPFYHFMPGTELFSFSTVGCNFRCKFCFHPETLVIHDGKPQRIKDLFEGAEQTKDEHVRIVRNSDTICATGGGRKINKAFRHHYSGELVGLKAAYIPPFECTPGHEVYVWRKNGMVKKPAASIGIGDWLVVPKLKAGEGKIPRLGIAGIIGKRRARIKKSRKTDEKKLREMMELKKKGLSSGEIGRIVGMHPTYLRKLMWALRREGISEKTFYYENDVVERGGRIKFRSEKGWIPANVDLDAEFAELLGYYVAEGWVSEHGGRPNSHTVIFSYGRHENGLADRTSLLLKKLFGAEARIRKRRTALTVEVCKSSVGVLFEQLCGKGAKGKRVPHGLFKAPKDVMVSFLRAYLKGDGTETGNNISMNTVSRELAMGLYHLLLVCGYLPAFYEWNPPKKKKIEGRTVNQSTLFYVKVNAKSFGRELVGGERKKKLGARNFAFRSTKDFWLVPVRKKWKRHYSGPVYNMEVEDEHSYLANFAGVGNCQNWSISQAFGGIRGEDLPPERIREICAEQNIPGAAYTYTEPTVFMEYALDTARLLHKDGRFNTFVTNGYMTSAAIREMGGRIDASRIDLKGFHDEVYRELCGDVVLEYVLQSIKELHRTQHIELINLVIPGWNDDEDDLRAMSRWVYELDPRIPVHFIGFYPANFMMDTPPTDLGILRRAREIALEEGLHYAYTGNRQDEETESTYCPKCRAKVVRRFGFSVLENRLTKDGKCPDCGEKLYFVNDIKEYWKSHPIRG